MKKSVFRKKAVDSRPTRVRERHGHLHVCSLTVTTVPEWTWELWPLELPVAGPTMLEMGKSVPALTRKELRSFLSWLLCPVSYDGQKTPVLLGR